MINKIFGIGLSRTGTHSLVKALELLGYRIVHYPPTPRLFKIVDKNNGAADITVAANFEILDQKYPNSKFILTIREIESWLKSAEEHFTIKKKRPKWQWELRKALFNTKYWDRDMFKEAYYNHVKRVENYFRDRPKDLLIMDIVGGDGFEKLTEFLYTDFRIKDFPHEAIS